jgi:hypothetical protein
MNVLVCAVHIVPYLKKYKANPCTGQPLEAKGLIKLNYQKNAAGEYHCPVMYKVSTVVIIRLPVPLTCIRYTDVLSCTRYTSILSSARWIPLPYHVHGGKGTTGLSCTIKIPVPVPPPCQVQVWSQCPVM